jgi:hypothetical protein
MASGLASAPQAEHLHADLVPQGAQLVDGSRPVDIGGHQQGATPLLLEVQAQLGGGGGFTGALETCHQHHRGGLRGLGQGGVAAAHDLHQLLMHQLDELLIRTDAPHHLGAHGPAAHLLDEILHHAEADIRLQQGPAHLSQGAIHVGLGDGGLAPQALDGIFKTLGELVKHRGSGGEAKRPWDLIVKRRPLATAASGPVWAPGPLSQHPAGRRP